MAAGLGFKDFVTGEVLTAADVDGYLMQGVWVFASAAARDAAVTSPQEGNFAYLKDTNVTTYYTGSAWANLDTTGMTNPMTTTGDTIYSSSGSTPARLGIGSTGNVLTVSGGVPVWSAPASGGGMTLISETVASAASSIAFNSISGSYKQLLLVWNGIQHSGTASAFGIRFNNDSGSKYVDQGLESIGGSSNTLNALNTFVANDAFGLKTSSATIARQGQGWLCIDNYASATKDKGYKVNYAFRDDVAGDNYNYVGVGYFDDTTAITSINIVRRTGTDTISNTGNTTIRLYGLS